MSKECNIYITTPVFYASDKPHLGHAFTVVLADVLKRHYSQLGHTVHLMVGTDEHGDKIKQAAEKAGLTPEEFTNNNVAFFRNLWIDLGIKYNRFLRTSDYEHKALVKQIFLQHQDINQVFIDDWKGWYCTPCEESFSDRAIGKEVTCRLGHPLTLRNERTYFLRTRAFKDWLIKEYEDNAEMIKPDKFKKELINNFIKDLDDLSITRLNLDWGIKVPQDEKHTIYVWFDALISYLTALNYGNYGKTNTSVFENFWGNPDCKIIQIIGKEIARFHGIYWPIMLKNLGLRCFDTLLIHGWLLMDNEKMSKSKKNVIDPRAILEIIPREGLRFYLSKLNWLGDSNVHVEDIFNVYNAYLVNTFGNLISRFYGIISKKYEYKLPDTWYIEDYVEIEQLNIELDDFLEQEYVENVHNHTISAMNEKIFEFFRSAGRLIEKTKAWELEKGDHLLDTLIVFIYKLLCIGTWILSPVLIDIAPKIYSVLNISGKKIGLEYLKQDRLWFKKTINELPENLFPRVKDFA